MKKAGKQFKRLRVGRIPRDNKPRYMEPVPPTKAK